MLPGAAEFCCTRLRGMYVLSSVCRLLSAALVRASRQQGTVGSALVTAPLAGAFRSTGHKGRTLLQFPASGAKFAAFSISGEFTTQTLEHDVDLRLAGIAAQSTWIEVAEYEKVIAMTHSRQSDIGRRPISRRR